MGVVYEAVQLSLGRRVALKVLPFAAMLDKQQLVRFKNEARAAATLDHPNIVPVYEVGEIDGQHFFSMGFVAGGSLQGLVQKGPLPPHEAARLVRITAEAVQHAHDHGVIHRDLKPHNVLFEDREDGVPKLTDFGLARITEEGGLSVTGDVMGTPSYMPPEQARGELKAIGPAADIYSLGAVLYCLLTGRPPFQAATPSNASSARPAPPPHSTTPTSSPSTRSARSRASTSSPWASSAAARCKLWYRRDRCRHARPRVWCASRRRRCSTPTITASSTAT
jgi:serine/threonine protein kinase